MADLSSHLRATAIPTGNDTPRSLYERRRDRFAAERDTTARQAEQLANLRLITFLAACAFAALALWNWALWPGLIAILLFVAFGILVRRYVHFDRRRRRFAGLTTINQEALARLARDWDNLPLRHKVEAPPDHAYAADLDLFGRASLLHLLDTTGTSFGIAALRGWLLAPSAPETVRARQQAVDELAPLLDLRDELALRGRLADEPPADPAPLLRWAEGEPWLLGRAGLIWASRLSPALLLATIILEAVGIVPYPVWIVFVLLNLLLRWQLKDETAEILDAVSEQGKAVFNQYAALFEVLTGADFSGPALAPLRERLVAGGQPADRQLRRLERIASFVLPGDALINTLLQFLTLWDLHVLVALERWQISAGPHLRGWLATLGEVEALAALARLAFDNPDWCFPALDPDALSFAASDLAHPLISANVRVANDVEVGPAGSFLLVTGSNMSGKSTLLRAIGVNTVLAQTGAPVCATALRLPPVDLWTSMRVQDSLTQGVSYFLAELHRLKLVVDAARRDHDLPRGGPRTLYLLDEILNGTNTDERRIAVRRIVRALVGLGAIGAISTHDLTLAETEEIARLAHPVYFTETVSNGVEQPTQAEQAGSAAKPIMSFDYTLRPGLATSRNALRLMDLIGLGGEDEP